VAFALAVYASQTLLPKPMPDWLPVSCQFFPGGLHGFPLFHKVIAKGLSCFLLLRAFVTLCLAPLRFLWSRQALSTASKTQQFQPFLVFLFSFRYSNIQ
jgi:hypothetical protein